MRKIEALIEYIKTKIHPEIANGFWNKYKDSDDHIKFEHLKYSFLKSYLSCYLFLITIKITIQNIEEKLH